MISNLCIACFGQDIALPTGPNEGTTKPRDLYLVCYAVRNGALVEGKQNKKSNEGVKVRTEARWSLKNRMPDFVPSYQSSQYRRPIACGVAPLRGLLVTKEEDREEEISLELLKVQLPLL